MLCILLGAVPPGCAKKPENTTGYVARVGNARLTQEELETSGADHAQQLSRQYVSNWVTGELLYQEAQRKGFAEKEEVLRRIEEAKRELIINAYLEQKVYAGKLSDINDEGLRAEFNSHRDAYRLHDDIVKMSFALFEEREPANAFRLKILRGASWSDAVKEFQSDSDTKQQILRVATQEYFTQSMLYPEELWKIARTLTKEDVSFVVKTGAGYCVVLVHATMKQGEAPDFDYAKNEIKERLTIEQRKLQYEELLATLRNKSDVEVRLDSVTTEVEHSNE
ncbi:MAG: peptidyl-prolyl cis-trans isomerase [bacterium]